MVASSSPLIGEWLPDFEATLPIRFREIALASGFTEAEVISMLRNGQAEQWMQGSALSSGHLRFYKVIVTSHDGRYQVHTRSPGESGEWVGAAVMDRDGTRLRYHAPNGTEMLFDHLGDNKAVLTGVLPPGLFPALDTLPPLKFFFKRLE